MNDRELLKLLGINNATISFELDEDIQIAIEKKIDNYLKKLDKDKKKQDTINYLKSEHEKFEKKKTYIDTFNDSYVYGKIKNKLIYDGFIYRCPFCLDVSHEYRRPIKKDK